MASGGGMVLVTGASGYIATHVVKQLLEAGYKVRGTVRSLKNEKKVQPLRDLCPEAKDSFQLLEADLLDADSWIPAVEGCDYVMHVASPVPATNPKTDDELVKPALEGTLSVLRACKAAGTVKRVVLTSSIAAIADSKVNEGKVFSEQDWTDEDDLSNPPYVKSKVKAEKAAWKFVEELQDGEKFELAVINPGFVMGPALCGTLATSMELPKRLMNREMPVVARLSIPICDVRDVATAHLRAMTLPEAAGQRHIISNETLWFHEIAKIMDEEFKSQGYNVPTKNAPKLLLRIASLFDRDVREMMPVLNKAFIMDNSRFVNVLGINPVPVRKSIIDMCYNMVEAGYIKKTTKYKPQGTQPRF